MTSDQLADWKDKVHEITFEDSLRALANSAIDNMDIGYLAALENVTSDGVSFKVKWVEFFSSYTFSLTYPKGFGDQSGHTYWYYYPTLEKGILLASWIKERVADGDLNFSVGKGKAENW